jgi:hypothetical protein
MWNGSGSTRSGRILVEAEAEAPENMLLPLPLCLFQIYCSNFGIFFLKVISFRFFYIHLNDRETSVKRI